MEVVHRVCGVYVCACVCAHVRVLHVKCVQGMVKTLRALLCEMSACVHLCLLARTIHHTLTLNPKPQTLICMRARTIH